MINLLGTETKDINPLDLLLGEERQRSERPWVMLNMIASIDGATAVDGKSTSLGDDDDREMFKAIRAVPDVILVGARTVTAEGYGPVSLDEERRARRVAKGLSEVPVLGIVTGRLSIDPEARVFSDPAYRPMVVTGTQADPSRLMMLGDAAEVVFLDDLSPASILSHLGAASVVLLEGGPSFNGQFIAAGLVDEINLTVSPKLVSGDSSRIAHGGEAKPPLDMRLDRVLPGQRALFLRYLRADNGEGI